LKEIRTRLDLTQEQMTERLHKAKPGLQTGHISEYESGKREPSLLVLLEYSRIGNVSMESLVDDDLDLLPVVQK
jgi:transcriptional regulator with XRE-family HTH domain